MAALTLLLLAIGVATITETVQQLRATPAGQQKGLMVQVVATAARTLGMVVLIGYQAVTFTTLRRFLNPFTPPPGVGRGWRAGRRRSRQFRGVEPYTDAEVPQLRAVAGWVLSIQVPSYVAAALLLFTFGTALAPLDPDPVGAQAALDRTVRVLSGVLFVVFAVAVALSPTRVRQLRQFLTATAPTLG